MAAFNHTYGIQKMLREQRFFMTVAIAVRAQDFFTTSSKSSFGKRRCSMTSGFSHGFRANSFMGNVRWPYDRERHCAERSFSIISCLSFWAFCCR